MGQQFNPFPLGLDQGLSGRGARWAASLPHREVWYFCPSKPTKHPGDGELVRKKDVQVHLEGYIEVGLVASLNHYFYIKKGLSMAV